MRSMVRTSRALRAALVTLAGVTVLLIVVGLASANVGSTVSVDSQNPSPVIVGHSAVFNVSVTNTGSSATYFRAASVADVTTTLSLAAFNCVLIPAQVGLLPGTGTLSATIGTTVATWPGSDPFTLTVRDYNTLAGCNADTVGDRVTSATGNGTIVVTTEIGAVTVDNQSPNPVTPSASAAFDVHVHNNGDAHAFNVSNLNFGPTGMTLASSTCEIIAGGGDGTISVQLGTLWTTPTGSDGFGLRITDYASASACTGGSIAVAQGTANLVVIPDIGTVSVTNQTPNPVTPTASATFDVNVHNNGDTHAFNVSNLNFGPTGVTLGSSTCEIIAGGGDGTISVQLDTLWTTPTGNGGFGLRIAEYASSSTCIGGSIAEVQGSASLVVIPDIGTVSVTNQTPNPVAPGSNATFDVNVHNNGDTHAFNVSNLNFGPAGVTLASSTCVVIGGGGDGTISIQLDTTASTPGGSNSFGVRIADYAGVSSCIGGSIAVVQGSANIVLPKVDTSTTLVSSVNPSNYGQSVTFTATVTPSGLDGAHGQVQFMSDGANIGSPAFVDLTGTATYQTSALLGGSHTIAAVYLGSSAWNGSTSNVVTQVVNPPLDLTNTPSSPTYGAVGDVITYNIVLTNTSSVTVTGAAVTDASFSNLSCGAVTTLAPGDTLSCIASHTTTQADINAGSWSNAADGSAAYGSVPLAVTAPATVTGPAAAPSISLTKTPSATTFGAVGDVITYSIVLKNTGNVTVTSAAVADSFVTDLNCSPVTTLAPGATLACTASHAITQADIDAGSWSNTADGSASFGVGKLVATDTATATGPAIDPQLGLKKEVTQTEFTQAGDSLNYTYTLTNSGNVTLTGPFSVDDDKITGSNAVVCPATPTELAPGGTIVCTATYTVTVPDVIAGYVENKATAHAHFGSQEIDSAQQALTVKAAATSSPSASATASASAIASPSATSSASPTVAGTEVVGGETQTPARSASPPLTSTANARSGDTPLPTLAFLAMFVCGALGLLAARSQRRSRQLDSREH